MHDSLVVKAVAVTACVFALAGCSLWLNTEERQCHDDSECVAAKLGTVCVQQVCMDTNECGGGKCDASTSSESQIGSAQAKMCNDDGDCGGKNRCLNKICVDEDTGNKWLCARGEASVTSSTVRYGFNVVDFVTRNPPKGVIAKACRASDLTCAEPVDTFMDTTGTGDVSLTLPGGFLGFFEIHSDEMDTLLYVTKPIVKSTRNRDIPVLTKDTVDFTATLLSYMYDPERGLVFLEAIECSSGTPQGGIHFEVIAGGDPFYIVDQQPSKTAKASVYDTVSNSATGGFVNVPVGLTSFTAQVGVDGMTLGSFNAQVRPRTVTYLDMHF